MPEPTTTTTATVSLTGALILLIGPEFGPILGPLFGEFLLAVTGAIVGVMHPASRQQFTSRLQAIAYVMRWVLTALVLVGALSAGVEAYIDWPAKNWPGVVAWAITFFADRWRQWLDPIGDALAAAAAAVLPAWLRGKKEGDKHDQP